MIVVCDGVRILFLAVRPDGRRMGWIAWGALRARNVDRDSA